MDMSNGRSITISSSRLTLVKGTYAKLASAFFSLTGTKSVIAAGSVFPWDWKEKWQLEMEWTLISKTTVGNDSSNKKINRDKIV